MNAPTTAPYRTDKEIRTLKDHELKCRALSQYILEIGDDPIVNQNPDDIGEGFMEGWLDQTATVIKEGLPTPIFQTPIGAAIDYKQDDPIITLTTILYVPFENVAAVIEAFVKEGLGPVKGDKFAVN